MVLTWERELLTHLPVFDHVTILAVESDDVKFSLLPKVLEKCPRLESLIFKYGGGIFCPVSRADLEWDSMPSCVLSSLKNFEYYDLRGYEDEILFMGFLLENASVLSKMVISFSRDDIERQTETLEQLSMITRKSAICSFVVT